MLHSHRVITLVKREQTDRWKVFEQFFETPLFLFPSHQENSVNTEAISINKNECSVASCVFGFLRFHLSLFSSVFTEFSRTDPFLFPPLFKLTTRSPSVWKAHRSNPRPNFLNCMQNEVTLVSFCLTTFHKKKTIEYYWTWCMDRITSVHKSVLR